VTPLICIIPEKIKSSGKHFTQRDKEILKNLLINYYNIIKNKKQIILARKNEAWDKIII